MISIVQTQNFLSFHGGHVIYLNGPFSLRPAGREKKERERFVLRTMVITSSSVVRIRSDLRFDYVVRWCITISKQFRPSRNGKRYAVFSMYQNFLFIFLSSPTARPSNEFVSYSFLKGMRYDLLQSRIKSRKKNTASLLHGQCKQSFSRFIRFSFLYRQFYLKSFIKSDKKVRCHYLRDSLSVNQYRLRGGLPRVTHI